MVSRWMEVTSDDELSSEWRRQVERDGDKCWMMATCCELWSQESSDSSSAEGNMLQVKWSQVSSDSSSAEGNMLQVMESVVEW